MGANGLKSDFGGHDNKHHQNIYAYVSVCFGAPMPFRYFHGFNDAFVNNTCAFERPPRPLYAMFLNEAQCCMLTAGCICAFCNVANSTIRPQA
eukprot:COSAG02_NODE_74_length_41878_cov_9.737954_16_plen_93_part_00